MFLLTLKFLIGTLITASLLLCLLFWLLAQQSTQHPELGVREGHLLPCPATPNCVSSQADPADKIHYLPPISFSTTPERAWKSLERLVHSQPAAEVTESTATYLRAEFRSRIFGFIDDVEFLLDPETQRIHFRSASRVGHSDFGANRLRMESIRAQLQDRLKPAHP